MQPCNGLFPLSIAEQCCPFKGMKGKRGCQFIGELCNQWSESAFKMFSKQMPYYCAIVFLCKPGSPSYADFGVVGGATNCYLVYRLYFKITLVQQPKRDEEWENYLWEKQFFKLVSLFSTDHERQVVYFLT